MARKPNAIYIVREGEATDEMLAKKATKMILKAGLFKEIKARMRFLPKGQRRRLKQAANRKKLLKHYTRSGEHIGQLVAEAKRYGGE